MAPQTFTRQNGPQAMHLQTGRQPNRGRIQKRNGGLARVDKDGDLEMNDGEAKTGRGGRRGGGRGGRGALESSGPSVRVNNARINRSINRRSFPPDLKHYPRSDRRITAGSRFLRPTASKPLPKERERSPSGLVQINIRGFHNTGVPQHLLLDTLIQSLQAHISSENTLPNDVVRIRKSRLEGDVLIISVAKEDVSKFTSLHQQKVAKCLLDVQVDVRAEPEIPVAETFKAVLIRRYNSSLKLLDLSHLKADPELVNLGLFSTLAREAKLFPVLMTVCDGMFTTQEQKVETISSISLAGNALTSIASVIALADTFPALKNLDLSDNRFRNLNALAGWRSKFRQLEHLVLSGNPLDTEESVYKDAILQWYPSLRMLNTLQVKSAEDVVVSSETKTSIFVSAPHFEDENRIAETFIKNFFQAYDSDRSSIIECYYDANTTFSLSVNTRAPKGSATFDQAKSSWEAYIRRSRNLDKITHLSARTARVYNGAESIRECWLSLPSTRHPNLLTEPQKWCIECQSAPGVPDPTGQSPGGVGGMIITIHGEFSEVDVSTEQSTCVRSFDRTFILGPSTRPNGVRVVCETLVLRRYGGSEAWKVTCPPQVQYQVQLPPGFGAPAPGKTEEQVKHEMLAVELSTRTNMTLEYSGMCLEQSGWSFEHAEMAFQQAKEQLPTEAFISSF